MSEQRVDWPSTVVLGRNEKGRVSGQFLHAKEDCGVLKKFHSTMTTELEQARDLGYDFCPSCDSRLQHRLPEEIIESTLTQLIDPELIEHLPHHSAWSIVTDLESWGYHIARRRRQIPGEEPKKRTRKTATVPPVE